MATPKKSYSIKEDSDAAPASPVFINRFKVIREGDFTVILAAHHSHGALHNPVMVTVPNGTLAATKASVMDYLQRVKNKLDTSAERESELTLLQPAPYFGNHVGFAHFGALAQLRFLYFNIGVLASETSKTVINARPILNLEMQLTTQLGLVNQLYLA